MVKDIILFASLLTMFSFWTNAPHAELIDTSTQNSNVPVVIELFTSQSCSSCPPADKLLNELSVQNNLITLSCHVTYWNHLRWKDTLSNEFCTKRQRNYSAYKKLNRVYTPQMVINGQDEFTGSKRGQAIKSITTAIKQNNVRPITLSKNGNNIEISLPALKKRGKYTIWVMGYKQSHTENIRSGENRGRKIIYRNSVLSLKRLATWSGEAESTTIIAPDNQGIDGLAIIAQDKDYGTIFAAGKIDF